jgi:hypothetical protein
MYLRYALNEIIDGHVIDDINGNNGMVVNGASIVNDAQRGPVLFLDGTNQHIRMPDAVTAGVNAMTIAAWYKWTDDDDRHWSRVIDIGSGTHSYLFISPRTGHDTIMLETHSAPTSAPVERLDGQLSVFDEWVHVAGVISGGNMTFYVNGEIADEMGVEFSPADLGDSDRNWLGRSQFDADAFFTGYIDNFVIYNRPLSQSDIQRLMNEDWSDIRGVVALPAVVAEEAVPPAAATAQAFAAAAPAPAAVQQAPAPQTSDNVIIFIIAAAVMGIAVGVLFKFRRVHR